MGQEGHRYLRCLAPEQQPHLEASSKSYPQLENLLRLILKGTSFPKLLQPDMSIEGFVPGNEPIATQRRPPAALYPLSPRSACLSFALCLPGLIFHAPPASCHPQELKNIHCLQSSARAFAALEAGGGVRCWGDPHCGGVVPKDVQEQLIDVRLGLYVGCRVLDACSVFFWGADCECFVFCCLFLSADVVVGRGFRCRSWGFCRFLVSFR